MAEGSARRLVQYRVVCGTDSKARAFLCCNAGAMARRGKSLIVFHGYAAIVLKFFGATDQRS